MEKPRDKHGNEIHNLAQVEAAAAFDKTRDRANAMSHAQVEDDRQRDRANAMSHAQVEAVAV